MIQKQQKVLKMNNFKVRIDKLLIALAIMVCLMLSAYPINAQAKQAATNNDVVVAQAASAFGGYYDGINASLKGDALRAEVADLIIDTHDYQTSYSELSSVFSDSDADPKKSGNILWFYTGTSASFNGSFSGGTNREHVWPKNAGKAFPESSGPGADAHHLRPTNSNLNSTRGNNSFDEVPQTNGNIVKENGSSSYANLCYQANSLFYPGVGYRGATARILMYMQTRWGDQYSLRFVDSAGSNKTIGKISTLLKWHLEEPPTQEEIVRNEVVYKIQGNRNPFIDHPEYAAQIYCYDGESYNSALQKVVANYGDYELQDPTSVTLSQTQATLSVGESLTVTASVLPADANQAINWTTSNASIATVTNGTIKAVGQGTCTITAASVADSTIKASLTVTVKAPQSIAVSGTPNKTEYLSGTKFDPTGLTVLVKYTDGTSKIVSNSSCIWVDGTTGKEALSAGTTTVICKIGTLQATVTGIVVTQNSISTTTVTRDSFTGSGAYAWQTFTTEEGVSGQAFMYAGEKTKIQINTSKTSYYFFNTTELLGGIKSITITTTGDKSFEILTSQTAYKSGVTGYPTSGTSHGVKTATSEGTTWEINSTDGFFTINYKDSGVCYVLSIEITYGSAQGGGQVTPPAHEHVFSTSWTNDETNHWHAAECEHKDQIADLEAHYDENGDRFCDVCSYEMKEVVPPVHEHTFSTEWSTDENQHWHASTCGHNDVKDGLADHADTNNDGKCDVCAYQMEEVIEHEHTMSEEWSFNSTHHWHASTCGHDYLTADFGEHVDEDGDGECDVCLYEQQGGQAQDKPSEAPAINCGASLNAGAIEISLAIMGAAFVLAMRKKSKKD